MSSILELYEGAGVSQVGLGVSGPGEEAAAEADGGLHPSSPRICPKPILNRRRIEAAFPGFRRRIGFKGFLVLCFVGRGFPSGQRGGTQDPVAQAYVGSNPTPRTLGWKQRTSEDLL